MKRRSAIEIGKLETVMSINTALDRVTDELERLNSKLETEDPVIAATLDRILIQLEHIDHSINAWLAKEDAS
jgi:hypothetical protein